MTNFTTTNSTAPPPYTSTSAHPHNSYMSPLTAVLCLVALITIPMLSYTFFMAIRCQRRPSRPSPAAAAEEAGCKAARVEVVCGVKYKKSASGSNSAEPCPVCLSVFAEGDEIRQLSACGHAFHAACVDMWLYSHSSCPVCRAAVPVKRLKRVLADGEEDFRHGLPDAANLI